MFAILIFVKQFYVMIINAGMNDSILRFYAESQKQGRVGSLLGSCMFVLVAVGILLTLLTMIVFLPFLRYMLHSEAITRVLLLTCLAAIVQSVCGYLLAYYRARHFAWRFMGAGLAVSLLTLVFTLCFVSWLPWGIEGIFLAQIAGYGSVLLVMVVAIMRETTLGISRSMLKKVLPFGLPMLTTNFGSMIMQGSPLFFLRRFGGLESVAIFSLGSRLAQICWVAFILPFQLALSPYVFGKLDDPDIKDKIGSMLTYYFLGYGLFVYFFLSGSRIVIAIIAPEGYAASQDIMVLLLAVGIWSGFFMFGMLLLQIVKKTKLASRIVLVSSAICATLHYFMIVTFDIYGAVTAANITVCGMGLCLFALGRKHYGIQLDARRTITVVLMIFSMFLCYFLLREKSDVVFYSTAVIGGLFGGLVMYRSRFFTANERRFIQNACRKLSRQTG